MYPAALFEWLFKYRPVVFENGRLVFGAGGGAWIVVGLALALAAAGIVTYRRAGAGTRPRERGVLAALRIAAVLLVVLCLLRPTLLVTTAIPQRNVLGVLLDDSQSMSIADDGATPRAETLRRLFGDAQGELLTALAARFQLRFFRFAGSAERIGPGDSLAFRGVRSDLAGALDHARRDLAALPLAGLVLVSDGADNSDSTLTTSLLGLAAAGVPVHTVGIGQERFVNDLELSRVEAPQSALRGSSILVEALVRQQGGGRDSADLVIEDGGQILAARRFALPGDGQAASVRVPVALPATGTRQLTVRVPGRPGETVLRNNERRVLVSVVDREERILYFEGEPRFEFAFLRRAVAGDPNLTVVGLQRTAEHKYLRLGVEDSLDLVGGFPRTREELFRYRALVLGSVEAAAFTADQLRMIADFVSRRGGGLLFLGGRRAFREGGYRDTPLEDVLPFMIDLPADTNHFRELAVTLTVAGRSHPVTQFAATEQETASLWASLPPVTSVNRVGALKPGATALLAGRDTLGRGEQVVLAHQRFGRGKVAALAIQDAWLWRMHADVAVEDTRHESFIRALLRWLASDVPDRVQVAARTEEVGLGEPVTVTVDVRDRLWMPVNGASVTGRLLSPTGVESTLPLDWVVGQDGLYRGVFPAREPGEYRLEPVAFAGDTLAGEPTFVRAGDVGREFFGAELRAATLRRIARETGGRYYTPETVSALPQDVVYTERGVTSTEQLDLWDMPIVFLTLVGLLAAEWGLRRRWGLA